MRECEPITDEQRLADGVLQLDDDELKADVLAGWKVAEQFLARGNGWRCHSRSQGTVLPLSKSSQILPSAHHHPVAFHTDILQLSMKFDQVVKLQELLCFRSFECGEHINDRCTSQNVIPEYINTTEMRD
jgi:hypothetical protein